MGPGRAGVVGAEAGLRAGSLHSGTSVSVSLVWKGGWSGSRTVVEK